MTKNYPEILSARLADNDANADTVRDYLVALLLEVWSEGEGFSGKRPFGNSGWEYDLYEAVWALGLAKQDDRKAAHCIIADTILSLSTQGGNHMPYNGQPRCAVCGEPIPADTQQLTLKETRTVTERDAHGNQRVVGGRERRVRVCVPCFADGDEK